MRVLNLIRIALVTPPITGHLHRGTGTYFNSLLKYLSRDPRIKVIPATLHDPLAGFDLIHFPYFDPFFLTMPLLGVFRKIPQLVTVHDLIPLKYPKDFPSGLLGKLKLNIQKNSLQKADSILTDSQSSKKDIVKIAGINEDKIHIIHLGADPVFKYI